MLMNFFTKALASVAAVREALSQQDVPAFAPVNAREQTMSDRDDHPLTIPAGVVVPGTTR